MTKMRNDKQKYFNYKALARIFLYLTSFQISCLPRVLKEKTKKGAKKEVKYHI